MMNKVLITGMLSMTLMSASSALLAHVSNCEKREGVEKLRCERHEKMFAKCGPLKGAEHHACDREFLLANPLVCKPLAGKAAEVCEAEVKAFKTCEPKQGREFAMCVRDAVGSSPMGH
jgi:hypothetical protein